MELRIYVTGEASVEDLRKVEQAFERIAAEAKETDISFERLETGGKEAAQGLERIDRVAREAQTTLQQMNTTLRNTATNFDYVRNAVTFAVVQMFEEAIFAVYRFGRESDEALRNFDHNWRQILTVVEPGKRTGFDHLQEQVRNLNVDLARTSDELLPAIYHGISRGIPEDQILEAVTLASEAARAGAADLIDTMSAGQAVVNAYGGELYNLTEVYDLFFKAIAESPITMQDLASGMARLTSVAGEAQVPLEDLMAMLVVMTQQGDGFNEAIELSSMMLMQLGIDGTAAGKAFIEAWGGTFRQFIAQGGTMAEAMWILEQQSQKTGESLASMVGGDSNFYRDHRTAQAVLELTGVHLDELIAKSEEFRTDAAGSMGEAAALMADSLEVSAQRTEAAKEQFQIALGEWMESWGMFSPSQIRENATLYMQAASGMLDAQIDDVMRQQEVLTEQTEIVAKFQSLMGASGDATFFETIMGGKARYDDMIRSLVYDAAIGAQSLTELRAAIEQTFGAEIVTDMGSGMWVKWGGELVRVTENYHAMLEALQAHQDMITQHAAEGADRKFFEESSRAATQYASTLEMMEAVGIESWRTTKDETMAATAALLENQRTLEIYRGSNERATTALGDMSRIAWDSVRAMQEQKKAAEEWAAALDNVQRNMAGYFDTLRQGGELEDPMEHLFSQGIAAGLGAGDLLTLGVAAGYKETALQAMLAAAQLRTEIDKVSLALAENRISAEQATQAVQMLADGQTASSEAALIWVQQVTPEVQEQLTITELAFLSAKLGIEGLTTAMGEIPEEVWTELGIEDEAAREAISIAIEHAEAWAKEYIAKLTVETDYTAPFAAPGINPGGGGGDIPYSSGGVVRGGVPGRDSVPARLMPGEVVITAAAARSYPGGPDALHRDMNGPGRMLAPFHQNAMATVAPADSGGSTRIYYDQRSSSHHYHNLQAVAIQRAMEDIEWERRANDWMPS